MWGGWSERLKNSPKKAKRNKNSFEQVRWLRFDASYQSGKSIGRGQQGGDKVERYSRLIQIETIPMGRFLSSTQYLHFDLCFFSAVVNFLVGEIGESMDELGGIKMGDILVETICSQDNFKSRHTL